MRIREAKKIYSSATREDPEALHCGRRIDGMQTGIWLGFSPFSLFFFLFFVFIPLACLPAACSLPMYLHVLHGDIAPPIALCLSVGANDLQRSSNCWTVGSKSRKVFWMHCKHPLALHTAFIWHRCQFWDVGVISPLGVGCQICCSKKSLAPKYNISTPQQPVLRVYITRDAPVARSTSMCSRC